jgi:hypothetical protein
MIFARRSAPGAPPELGPIRRLLRWIASPTGVALLAVLAVAGVGAAISYSHMFDWAKINGDTGPHEWRAYLFPISVDGAIVAASAVIYADARAGRKADWLAYVTVSIGMAMSVTANVVHDQWRDDKAEWVIAGWPAVALGVGAELMFRFVRRVREHREALAEVAAEQEQARLEAQEKAEARRRKREEKASEDLAEEAAEIVQLRATGTDGAERPGWLAEGATAEQAMRTYLSEVDSSASGADLDRMVGTPYFGTAPGYGRKVRRSWQSEQEV